MDEVLFFLLKAGVHKKPVRISTTEIGKSLGMSQQNASRRLAVLEEKGLIDRGKDGVAITAKGMEEAGSVYYELKGVIEGKTGHEPAGRIELTGRIEDGLGEGRYYLSLPGYRKEIEKKLGFTPFPGTLNIRIDKAYMAQRMRLKELEPIIIGGFTDAKRTFGDLYAYRCRIDGKPEGALIIPLRTHHGMDVVEVIAPVNLKKSLGRKAGDRVRIEVF